MERSSLQRVKVYQLNAAGTWDDNGTGHVLVEKTILPKPLLASDAAPQESKTEQDSQFHVTLKVASEEVPAQMLLEHVVSASITYQLQGGMISTF